MHRNGAIFQKEAIANTRKKKSDGLMTRVQTGLSINRLMHLYDVGEEQSVFIDTSQVIWYFREY